MTSKSVNPLWTTASFGGRAETSTTDVSALGEHLTLCRSLSGRMFALQCGAEAMHSFAAPRFVTVLSAVTVLIGIGLIVL